MENKPVGVLAPGIEQIELPEQTPESIDAAIQAEADKYEKIKDRELETFAGSALSSATLGLSDQALTKSGIVDPKELRELREEYQSASDLGTLTGIVAPLIIPGGQTSLLGKIGAGAAKTAGAPARGATSAGRLVEESLKNAIARSGNKALAKDIVKNSIAKTVGSAVEGSFYGAGQLVSEEALGTAELNAENLLSAVGTGAAVGGLFGGALAVTAPAASKVFKSIGNTSEKVSGAVKNQASKYLDADSALGELFGMTPKKIADLKIENPKYFDDIRAVVQEENLITPFKQARDVLATVESAKERIGRQIDSAYDVLDTAVKADPRIAASKVATYERMADRVEQSLKEFTELNAKGERVVVEEAKQFLGPVIKYTKTLRNNAIKAAREGADSALTASDLRAIRDIQTELAKFDTKQMPTKMARAARAARSEVNAVIQEVADRAAASALARQAGVPDNIAEIISKSNKKFTVLSDLSKGMRARSERLQPYLNDIDFLVSVGGVAAGTNLESPELAAGALSFAMLRKFVQSDFRRRIQVLSSIEKQNKKLSIKMKDAAENLLKGASTLRKASTSSIMNSVISFERKESGKMEQPKSKQQAVENAIKNISEYAQNNEYLLEKVAKSNLMLDSTAPKTAEAFRSATANAILFLNSKIPRSPLENTDMEQFARKYKPSDAEISKFSRYLQAVEDPGSVIDDFGSGQLTREQVEAMQAVYPQLYNNMRNIVIDKVVEREDIPYDRRMQLGILLQVDADASLKPDMLLQLQSTYAKQEEAPKPTGKIEITKNLKSGTEQTLTRTT
ncbi:MAG: hypothetical protein FMNOHCHN_03740 [Ignavibacteriaceae bacterium]|nr:hypothetical protein [Ignavibacteriaceae bacterium]